MASVTCVDISEFQQNIDFNKMKNDGIKAVIIRAGYGRETSQKDSMFESHYRNAKSAGLKVGAYWYSYADSINDAEKEAKAFMAVAKGKNFDFPIYYDLEDSSQIGLGKSTLTAIAERFCDTLKRNNYKVGVYANLNWFNNYLDYKKLKAKYSIWLAQYNDKAEIDCDIWQNSSSGRINGYSGRLDTNIVYDESLYNYKNTSEKPSLIYRVFADHKWYSEVKGLSNIAGRSKQAISAIAIMVTKGKIRYRVHLLNGDWLPWVTGYNINDGKNGYAGIKEKVIDAIQIEYINDDGDSYKATYRVRLQGESKCLPYQHDTETCLTADGKKQDGYAGIFGFKIDGLQITLT